MQDATCLRCGHKWQPRVDIPQRCPRCQSWNWQKSREDSKRQLEKVAMTWEDGSEHTHEEIAGILGGTGDPSLMNKV